MADFFEKNPGIKTKLAEHKAVDGWHEVLGEGVAHYTKNVYMKRGTLYVQLASSVLRAELLMNKPALIKKLNEHAGMTVVRDIVLR